MNCLFCNLINDKSVIKLFENDDVIAINDKYPKSAIHLLVIPKLHIANLLATDITASNLLGKIMYISNVIAIKNGMSDGYQLHINNGKNSGQEIFHLHIHLMGG